MGPGIELHRPVAHAGSSAPIDPAGSPARRGWPRWQMKALMEGAEASEDGAL
jgi:hypothetical protein